MKKSPGLTMKTFECPTHGAYTGRAVVLGEGHEIAGRCPQCVAEQARGAEDTKRAANVKTMLARAEIPLRYRDRTFENYRATTPAQNRVRKAAIAFAERFDARRRMGCSLVLCGRPGTGKTHLACAIARAVIEQHGCHVWYVTTAQACRLIKQTFNANSIVREQDMMRRFTQADLLILDEVGGSLGTDFELAFLTDVLNERYAQVKPTILITNMDLKALTAYLGERTLDRFREGGGATLVLEWESYRARVENDDALQWPAAAPALE